MSEEYFSEDRAGEKIAEIIRRMVAEQPLDAAGQASLEEWLSSNPEAREVYLEMRDPVSFEKWLEWKGYFRSVKGPLLIQLKEETRASRHRIQRRLLVSGIAASLLIAITATLLVGYLKQTKISSTSETAKIHDIVPGRNKAILTLSNGSTVVLDSLQNGVIPQQGHARLVKLNDEQLAYQAASEKTGQVLYNTLTTPLGGQYHLTLEDGSSVFLNAGSSLQYPISFAGAKQREVVLTGEAYFEVNKKPSVPFVVKVNGASIQVLGTHFNIMAYSDEPVMETTLLEGSIQVSQGAQSKVLHPDEQAQLTKGNVLSVHAVDAEEYTAWKKGLIQLHHADIPAVMRQISRWYDVQVDYQGTHFPTWTLAGTVPRTLNLSEVLKVLELNGIHCRLDGKKVSVLLKD
jgi:transmembrane sensor